MPSCSVIMVSYHTGPVLLPAIKNVLRQKKLEEIILVDNGNSPAALTRLQQMALTEPRLKIVTGQGNIGFAKACNLAARQAAGEYLLFLHPDCLLPPEALRELTEALETLPGAIIAGGRLVDAEGRETGDLAPLASPAALFTHLPLISSLVNGWHHAPPPPLAPYEVEAVSGACLCIRAGDFARIGGFDEAFFLSGADLDLGRRVHNNSGKSFRVPAVTVTRMRSAGAKVQGGAAWQKTRGLRLYFRKHFRGRYWPGVLALAESAVILRGAWCVVRERAGRLRRQSLLMTQGPAAKRLMILASGLAELPAGRELYGTTVLVTGATGQVGLCVVRRLIAAGAAVLAISRAEAIPFQHEHLRWIKGDLTDAGLNLHGYLADAIIHCAPLWHLPPTVALLAEAEVKRVVAFGSTSIFAQALSKNHHEQDLVRRLMKAEAEIAAFCAAKNMDWTILRPTLIYGVGLDAGITSLAHFIERAGFFPVYPPASGRRQPVHADDLAMAALQALQQPEAYGKSYNVSGGEIVTYREMLARLFSVCRKKPRIIATTLLPFILDAAGGLSRKKHINGEIARRMNDDLVFFHEEARKDFGFSPRPFLSGGLRDIEGF